MTVTTLLDVLKKFDALRGGDVIRQRSLPAIEPAYADQSALAGLTPEMRIAVERCGISRLYQHQVEAIQHARSGSNVVLQAPTASGKTLAFQIPMLESLAEDNSHALMIFPNKALAFDQRDQLQNIVEQLDSPIESWGYDGDVTDEHKKVIRDRPPSVLLTNPEMLNRSFLGWSEIWRKFYEGLKWIIVDEIHEYRGYFGSNVAMILRRLSHHLSSLGVTPQFFLSSATCANAREHAENLTGRSFVEVNATHRMRPRRDFVFVQPAIRDHRYWQILQLRAVNAGLACVTGGQSVLVFCPSRKFAESCYSSAMRRLEELDEDRRVGIDPASIRVIRAGLSPDERRTVQAGLKNGAIRLCFTTSLLEMGIDIGQLDGIIMAGFPDNAMSAWQRIGRAGRSWDAEAFVLYYARNNALDEFYAENLETFLEKPLDDLVVNPDNEELVKQHVPALLYETPDLSGDADVLGATMGEAARRALKRGVKPIRSGPWRPHISISVRGKDSGTYTLLDGKEEIGTLSSLQQFREAYDRAIYMHGGRTYRVAEISSSAKGGRVALQRVNTGNRTNPISKVFVNETEILDGKRWSGGSSEVEAFHGRVRISEQMFSIEETDPSGAVVDQWQPTGKNGQFANAHAFWIEATTGTENGDAGILAFQHLLRLGSLFSIPLDAHDIFPHAVAKDGKAYIVESYPGGIGVAKKVLERWRSVVETGIGVAERCECRKGCPHCIVPPRSKEEWDKNAGIRFARAALDATDRNPNFRFRNNVWEPV